MRWSVERAEPAPGAISLGELGRRIVRGYRTVAGFGLAGAVLAAAYLLVTPAVYQSEVLIRIDPRPLHLPRRDAASKVTYENQTAISVLESQVRILESTPLLTSVVDSLALARDREFVDGTPSLAERARDALAHPGSATATGVGAAGDGSCQAGPTGVAPCPETARRTALGRLRKAVTVRRLAGSYVLAVRVTSRSPDTARRIADALTATYLSAIRRDDAERLKAASRQVAAGLSSLEEAVRSDGDEVGRARRKAGIVDGARGSVDEQQLAEVTRQLLDARAQLQRARTRCDYLRALSRSDAGLDAEAFPDFPALEALRLKGASLAVQEEGLTARLGPRHPDVARMAEQRRRNGALLRQELERTAASECNERARAQSVDSALSVRARDLERTVLAASAAGVELRDRLRRAVVDGSALEAAERRVSELEQGSALSLENVRVLGPAEEPRGPVTSRARLVAAAIAAGAITGAAWLATRSPRGGLPAGDTGAGRGIVPG
jgi:polysaccharide biosynthesis transport protein